MFKIQNKDIIFHVGNHQVENLRLTPFDDQVCSFLSEFSKKLMIDKNAKRYTDLIALAFWCRKNNLIKLKNEKKSKEIRIGRGLIFHITPSNVPTNFFYSLIFGLLSGNSNIVKVPSKKFIQISIISSIIKKLLKKKKYRKLKKMITIIEYNNNNNITKFISQNCDSRVIWGGDKTINNVREFNLKPQANEITFGDRYSISIINTDTINTNKNNSNLERLTQNFYNDTMIMDQNACTSPHLVFWLGDEETPDYAAGSEKCVDVMSKERGIHPSELFLDLSDKSEGKSLFNYRMFNQNLEAAGEMFLSDRIFPGLGDAGAHVSQICDAGWATFVLSHWVRETGLYSLEEGIRRITSAPARIIGLKDRGTLEVGKKADVNVFDAGT